ncbi:unnamed protein product, partial [Caenorhabditis auriculariae]
MVFIVIRLVGEAEDRLFKNVVVEQQISRVDLVKLIQDVTQIPVIFQQIKLCGQELPDSLNPLESIKDFEEIEVCHTMLVNWRTYIQMISEIKRLTTSGVTAGRREIALKARIQLSPLQSSKFFAVYPSFAIEEMNIGKSVNFLIHNTKKYLHRSVSAYFEAAYPEKTVELKDKSEEFAGIHLGVFVFIDHEPSYYAKTLGSIPGPDEESDFPNCPKIDLMEIYVYFLLKLIGVGPVEVHVIPDITKSDLVFMATKLVDGFRTASGISASEIIASTSSEVIGPVYIDTEMRNQMKILSSLLCLSDLQRNKGNHGVVEQQTTELEKKEDKHCSTRELRIIDFRINLGMIDSEPSILNSSFDIAYLNTYFA